MPRHTNYQVRKAAINLSEQGKASREISALLKIGKSTVNRIIEKFTTTKCLSDLPRFGRPRKTTVRVNKIIKRKSTNDVKKTASEIAQELRDENLPNVSKSTVSRHLHDDQQEESEGPIDICTKVPTLDSEAVEQSTFF